MRTFITGTDTDVGKTIACAWLMLHTKARYWKPVQAGLDETDEATIRALTGAGDERFIATTYNLPEPLSPHEAAKRAGVRIIPDICWCSITEPVFPRDAKVLITNSGKYSHYAQGLTGCGVRFGSLSDCARAARTGRAAKQLPDWLSQRT